MNIAVHKTDDIGWINGVINHPAISPFVRDDSHVGDLDVSPLQHPDNLFLRLICDDRDAGFGVALKHETTFEVHSGVLPDFRGRAGVALLRAGCEWVFRNTDADKLESSAWSTAKHVILAARLVGFRETGRSPWPNTVMGQRVDNVLLEMARPTVCRKSTIREPQKELCL